MKKDTSSKKPGDVSVSLSTLETGPLASFGIVDVQIHSIISFIAFTSDDEHQSA